MTEELFNSIKVAKLFSSLSDEALHKLTAKFEKITVRRNRFLFRQGDVSDGLFLLVSGKLVVLVTTRDKKERLVGDVRPGETLGEIGAIAHEPRSASAKALENSVLFKLSREIFCQLCNEYPSVLLETMNLLGQRSRSLTELFASKEPVKKHIVFLSANKKLSCQAFADKIRDSIKEFSNVLLLFDEPALYEEFPTTKALEQYIADYEKEGEKILYVLGLKNTPLSKIAFDNIDMLYVVAKSDAKPYFNALAKSKLHNKELAYKAKPELIILHDNGKDRPHGTEDWLKLAKFAMQHHIRVDRQTDWERLIRFVRGHAVGVVLGGGGVRGWAHIGALRGIHEAGIPIDVIGGTSGGSIVAGYYALHETYEDSNKQLQKLSDITRKAVCVTNLTWPAASIFSSKSYTKELRKVFTSARIENLWVPYFCVTCNLSKSDQVMHRLGFLWKKIRGSTAVPGVYPPLVIAGELHLDGGIVNNLPTDLMRKMSSSIGTVIAVELIHNVTEEKNYKFPPILPFFSTLLTKLRLINKDYRFPHFIDMFLRSLLVGSAVKQRENAKSADVLISPDLSGFNLLSVSSKQAQQLMDLGYRAAQEAIKHWQQGVKPKKRPTRSKKAKKAKIAKAKKDK